MKLFFIIENTLPHASGGGYYAVFRYAEFLARRGHTVTVYAVHKFEWVRPVQGLSIVYRPHIPRHNRVLRKLDKYVERVTDSTHLERLIRKLQPDWIFGVLKEQAIKAVEMGRRTGVPVANFVYEVPLWLEEAGGERFTKVYTGYFRQLWERTRDAYLASQLLFPTSEMSGDYASRWLDGKAVTEPIYPGIDIEELPPPAQDLQPRGMPSVLYVGRLAPLKNVDLLIRAVKRSASQPRCHIVGAGPEMGNLRKLAGSSENIVFHGIVSDDRLWAMIQATDILIYPTSFEGFGMPPMQAFYCGKPCIASDIPILRSIFGDMIDYFPHGDEAALAARIDELLADPAYRDKRGREGREAVLQRFTWKLAAERIEANLLAYKANQECRSAVEARL